MARHNKNLFDRSHIRELRPFKVSKKGHNERFVFPEINEMKGTPFALVNDEERFVTSMLDGRARLGLRKHNMTLFRTDQKMGAGDFVCVDISGRPLKRGTLTLPCWDVFVMDLKMGARLQLGGGGAGRQLRNAQRAARVAHACVAERCVGKKEASRRGWKRFIAPRRVWLMVGDRRELLSFFKVLRHLRRRLKRTDDTHHALAPYYMELTGRGAA